MYNAMYKYGLTFITLSISESIVTSEYTDEEDEQEPVLFRPKSGMCIRYNFSF